MFHRHKWTVSGVRTFLLDEKWGGMTVATEPKTEILMVCSKCPKVKVKEINGRWTLEQVRGQTDSLPL